MKPYSHGKCPSICRKWLPYRFGLEATLSNHRAEKSLQTLGKCRTKTVPGRFWHISKSNMRLRSNYQLKMQRWKNFVWNTRISSNCWSLCRLDTNIAKSTLFDWFLAVWSFSGAQFEFLRKEKKIRLFQEEASLKSIKSTKKKHMQLLNWLVFSK